MKKIPCLFIRHFKGRDFEITRTVSPGCEWVLRGDGIATRKWDGTACAVIDSVLYKRYDAKKDRTTGVYKTLPVGAIPCDEPDDVTGHWPHWVAVGQDDPADRWHVEAWKATGWRLRDGTYELVGPKINGNAEQLDGHEFMRHGGSVLDVTTRTFDGISAFLSEQQIEGIVFHHQNARDMCKIRRHDFGFQWPVTR